MSLIIVNLLSRHLRKDCIHMGLIMYLTKIRATKASADDSDLPGGLRP
jgi:hypothetical protein